MDKKPTARAAALGMTIFDLMCAKGWRNVDLSARVGWSQTKMSRLKTGDRPYSVIDIAMILAILDVKGDERDELLAIAESLTQPNSWLPPVMSPVSRARFLTCLERIATHSTWFSRTVVPPQLQSREYVRFLTDNAVVPQARAENLRSTVAEQSPFTLAHARFFLSEAALVPADLPPEVTAGLLHHLLRLAVRPDTQIRLVPDSVAIPDCPTFTHMTFADHRPLVHIEAMSTSVFLEHDKTLAHSRAILATLDERALPAATTRERLLELATDLTTPSATDPDFPDSVSRRAPHLTMP